MNDYMKRVLEVTGVETLEELIKSEEFIEYCKKFNENMMEHFRDKVESYIIFKIKQKYNK